MIQPLGLYFSARKPYGVKIRRARLSDMEAIEAIYNDAQRFERQNDLPSGLGSPYYQADRDFIARARKGEDRYQVIVAEQRGKVVGYARALHLLDKKKDQTPKGPRKKQTTLHKLGVLSEKYNKGIGGLLMDAVIEKAKSLGREHIRIMLPQGNPFGFYQKHGFKVVKTFKAKLDRRPLEIVELDLRG